MKDDDIKAMTIVCPNCRREAGKPCLSGYPAQKLGWYTCKSRRDAAKKKAADQ